MIDQTTSLMGRLYSLARLALLSAAPFLLRCAAACPGADEAVDDGG